jgi:hypothetical protein
MLTRPEALLFLAIPFQESLPDSSVAEQVTVNHLVVGSTPTRAAISISNLGLFGDTDRGSLSPVIASSGDGIEQVCGWHSPVPAAHDQISG